MRISTPIEELNIDELNNIVKTSKENLKESLKKERDKKTKWLDDKSLYYIANNSTCCGDYSPCIFDFLYILERLKNKTYGDEKDYEDTFEESLKIRIEISEQISKMKEVPAFDTECHIESIYLDRCTSILNFIRKVIFKQNKYRLVFHNNKCDYNNNYYKSKKISFSKKIILLEVFTFLLSILLSSTGLMIFDFFAILITLIIITINYISD